MDDDKIRIILQVMAWERVKGDLRAFTQSFYGGRPNQQREVNSVIEEFIEKMEKEVIDTV